MVLPLVTHVPAPTWRVVGSEVWAMAGGKSTYLCEGERGGGRGRGREIRRVRVWAGRGTKEDTLTKKGVLRV